MDNEVQDKKSRLDTFHKVVTLATAIAAVIMSIQQHGLKAELDEWNLKRQYEQATLDYTKTIFEKIKDLGLDVKQKRALTIVLLDIISEVQTSETGKSAKITEQRLIPMRLALMLGDVEALAHIGSWNKKEWLKISHLSGNATVRKTAIEALGLLAIKDSDPTVIFNTMKEVMLLSNSLTDTTSVSSAVSVINSLLKNLENHETFEATPDQLLFLNMITVQISNRKEEGNPHGEAQFENITMQLAKVSNDLTPMPINTKGESHSEIVNLIDELESEETGVRRAARKHLANLGNDAIKPMVEALHNKPDSYRVWLGVAYVLSKIDNPVITDNDVAESLCTLLSSNFTDIRKYGLEFLRHLKDENTIDMFYKAILNSIHQELEKSDPNPMGINNGILVLGHWPKRSEPDLDKIDKRLEQYSGNWSQARANIESIRKKAANQ